MDLARQIWRIYLPYLSHDYFKQGAQGKDSVGGRKCGMMVVGLLVGMEFSQFAMSRSHPWSWSSACDDITSLIQCHNACSTGIKAASQPTLSTKLGTEKANTHGL